MEITFNAEIVVEADGEHPEAVETKLGELIQYGDTQYGLDVRAVCVQREEERPKPVGPRPKIIQIQSEQPVGVVKDHAKAPLLFGLSTLGEVFVWAWTDKKWMPLEEWENWG